ncbi:MAG: zinc-ribbon domain-containing protein [Chloroflexota bacterium]|nr:zinc-ribbon domain-containing protein [Chloroflexota bacterium]
MITCPNCGNPVREAQQFCGSCGTDVHAALAAASHAATPTVGEEQPAPYAYPQAPGYGYEYEAPAQSPGGSRIVIIGIAIIVVACCMCAAGLLVGLEAS